MSNLPVKPEEFIGHDFTQKDLENIERFKENGMLGLASLSDTDIVRMMELYMDGKSYRQISTLLRKDKSVILYLSQKLDWPTMRREYLEELASTLKDKVTSSKLQSQEFLLHLTTAYQKKIGRLVDTSIRSGDNTPMSVIVDPKDLTAYLKVVEMLHKLNGEMPTGTEKAPMVGLNGLGEGMTITRTSNNSVEITPKAPDFKSKLKEFADAKREMEKQRNQPISRDIIVEQPTEVESSKNEENSN